MLYNFSKPYSLDMLEERIKLSSIGSKFIYFNLTAEEELTCYMTENLNNEEQSILAEIVNTHNQVIQYQSISTIIKNAMEFGNNLIVEFSTENILLGITQLNQTGAVLNKLVNVQSAVLAGSLYEAIHRVREIPSSDYDTRFITEPRLLLFINKIEAYLGIPLSTEL